MIVNLLRLTKLCVQVRETDRMRLVFRVEEWDSTQEWRLQATAVGLAILELTSFQLILCR